MNTMLITSIWLFYQGLFTDNIINLAGNGMNVITKPATDQVTNIIKKMGEKNVEHAKKVQAKSLKMVKKINHHDYEHPNKYPREWNKISNKEKICWFHKVTKKRFCEYFD